MSEEIEIVIREALPEDAEALLNFLGKVALETNFLSMDAEDFQLSVEEEAHHLTRILESENNCLFVARFGELIIGTASIAGNKEKKLRHIGELGVTVASEYWGFGLGTNLVAELIEWAEQSGIIRRIELTVQARNQRAIDLYRKMGFVQEGVLQRGVFSEGQFLDVYLMSCMID